MGRLAAAWAASIACCLGLVGRFELLHGFVTPSGTKDVLRLPRRRLDRLSAPAVGAVSGGTKALGTYKALTKIKVRMMPDMKSPTLVEAQSQKLKTGQWFAAVEPGQVFDIAEERTKDGQSWLKLKDQDGWVISTGIAGSWAGRPVVEIVSDDQVIEEKARSYFQSEAKRITQNPWDASSLYIIGGTILSLIVFWALGYLDDP
eukprot:TRINITY_DN76322_c0_g1_i1.p1 TRINITY_DN76322_c0_g1~~TRINITY_DN76322_c0_g1_i1.p1  ORF type:complete len:203 (+),score=38.51 TRINITY_DN76322_c0_g1_i1:60-668(+)